MFLFKTDKSTNQNWLATALDWYSQGDTVTCIHDDYQCNYEICITYRGKIILYKPANVHTSNQSIPTCHEIRDWSLIMGRGGLQNGKIAGPKLFAPPPQDRVKLFAPPLLKIGNFSCPPYNMAKTSSYYVKTTPKLFVPPL